MIEPESQQQLVRTIRERMAADRALLDQLRLEIRPLRSQIRRIQPRSATAVSLVGTDGGNNRLQFDPFLVQLVRVVDSSNNEYCLEAITPTTSVAALGAQQFTPGGQPRTPLGELMAYLGVRELPQLTHISAATTATARRARVGCRSTASWSNGPSSSPSCVTRISAPTP